MPSFKNIKDLERYMKMKVGKAVQSTSVEDTFQFAMVEAVYDEVYNVYEPKRYERRQENDGLSDPNNMAFTSIEMNGNSFVAEFENLTISNGMMAGEDGEKFKFDLSPVIENGVDGWTEDDPIYKQPRPFAAETVKKLNEGSHNARLKSVLEREINK